MYGRTRGIFAYICCRITHPVPAHVSRYPRPSDTSHCHSSSAITFFYTRTRLARHLAPPLTRGARACPKTSRKPAWSRTTTPPPTAVSTARRSRRRLPAGSRPDWARRTGGRPTCRMCTSAGSYWNAPRSSQGNDPKETIKQVPTRRAAPRARRGDGERSRRPCPSAASPRVKDAPSRYVRRPSETFAAHPRR